MPTQNNSHLSAGRVPLPTRCHQITSGRCEGLLLGVESTISKCSALRESFQIIGQPERAELLFFELANQAPLRSIRNISEISSLQSGRLSPSAPLGPIGTCRELAVVV